jgi:hypothetical protein
LRRAAFADFWYRVTRRRVVGGPMAQRAQGHNAVLPHHFLTGV